MIEEKWHTAGDLAELLAKHFSTIGGQLIQEKEPTALSDAHLECIDQQVVHQLLHSIDTTKATHSSDFPAWVSKNNADIICVPMTNIINCMLKTRRFPALWKLAEVIPLPKVKNPSNLSDFRPISLLHHLSKIAEKVFASQYKKFVLPKISRYQFAYQQGLSTTDALIYTLEDWCSRSSHNSRVHIIFKDFSKAFDMMQPPYLIAALRRLGIKNGIIELARDFLTNRSLRVNVSGKKSSYHHCSVGVPQGTICGPLFWLAFIDSYHPPHTKLTMYADDITCYWNNSPSDTHGIQERIDYGLNWCKNNSMKLNLTKTKAMCLKTKPLPSSDVEVVTSIKFLGVQIDDHLKFNNHVSYIISKANKRFYALLQLKRMGVDRNKLTAYYCANIRSVLVYAIPAFYSHLTKSAITSIEAIQRKCTKVIVPDIVSYSARLTVLNLVTLDSFMLKLTLRHFNSILTNKEHRLHCLLPKRQSDQRRHSTRLKNAFIVDPSSKSFINFCSKYY
jgi:hypothetical protein